MIEKPNFWQNIVFDNLHFRIFVSKQKKIILLASLLFHCNRFYEDFCIKFGFNKKPWIWNRLYLLEINKNRVYLPKSSGISGWILRLLADFSGKKIASSSSIMSAASSSSSSLSAMPKPRKKYRKSKLKFLNIYVGKGG